MHVSSTSSYSLSVCRDILTRSSSSSGVTQAIRVKLRFNDEAKWKKFSARRLELIDDLGLSTKKASEQEDKIAFVADSLREEYGFPQDTLADFDKLVRAGIQSVRRNRKRSRQKQQDEQNNNSDNNKNNNDNDNNDSADAIHANKRHETEFARLRISSPFTNSVATISTAGTTPPPATEGGNGAAAMTTTATVLSLTPTVATSSAVATPSSSNGPETSSAAASTGSTPTEMPTKLPSLSALTSDTSQEHFIMAVERLERFVAKVPPLSSNGNLEFLGASILSTAAAHAVDRIVSHGQVRYGTSGSLRDCILGYTVTSALVRSLGLFTLSSLNLTLATCCREFGFDAIILSLSNIYCEMVKLDATLDFSKISSFEKVASSFPRKPRHNITTNIASSATSLAGPTNQLTIKPVTIRFADKKLEFTYNPMESPEPPTLAELLDNGRAAFGISSNQIVFIRHVGSRGRILANDEEIKQIFIYEPRIDLEFSLLRPEPTIGPGHHQLPRPGGIPRFQELA